MNQFKQLCIWYQDHSNSELPAKIEEIYGVPDEDNALNDVISLDVMTECQNRGINREIDHVVDLATNIIIEAISDMYHGDIVSYDDVHNDYETCLNEHTFI